MAVPLTVPRLGLDSHEALVAEWYQPDGATVHKGEPVYRLEVDYIAVEVEADDDGILRHQAEAGRAFPSGEVVAYILGPGERLPGRKRKKAAERVAPEATEDTEPAAQAKREPASAPAYAFADVLGAGVDEDTEASSADVPEGLPWDAFPGAAPQDEPEESFEEPAPVLLFPRIVSALRAEAEQAVQDEDGEEEEVEEEDIEVEDEPSPLRARGKRVSAWDLVPGETDFNPEWIMERRNAPDGEEKPASSRFQASSIRNLALGRSGKDQDRAPKPAIAPEPVEPEEEETTIAEAPPAPPVEAAEAEVPVAAAEEPAAEPEAVVEATPVEIAPPERPRVEDLPPAVVAPIARVAAEPVAARRPEPAAGPALSMRVSVDMNEASKMREQLTREWWGSQVRPTDEDITLRAIARALADSSAFRRRSDGVGMRLLVGPTRGVHLLPDAATRPFRDAVASMAALRETPGAEIPCVCTLTPLAEFDLDEGVPALPEGQPLAFCMGAVRDVARFRGDHPYRAREMTLTLAYDSAAIPDAVAARFLARVRELLEAPYALLAH